MAGLQEAGAAFGLHVSPPEPAATEVWAENWPAVRIFEQVQSQWRTGPSGPLSLDYLALPAWCRPGVAGSRRGRRLAEALQVMEVAALEHWEQQREQSRDS